MDQQEVDVVGSQLLEAAVDRGGNAVACEVVRHELGREKDVAAVDSAALERRTDPVLVRVSLGGVDVTVAERQRLLDAPLAVVAGELEGAEAERGNVDSLDGGDVHGQGLPVAR